MKFNNDSAIFSEENIKSIEKVKNAEYVIDTEHNNISCAVFYGDTPHKDSGSRYFALYYTPIENQLMITDGSFIEEQVIMGVVSEDDEVVFSRHRHDYRQSQDGSVFIDGGRAYMRSNTNRTVAIKVSNGKIKIEKQS